MAAAMSELAAMLGLSGMKPDGSLLAGAGQLAAGLAIASEKAGHPVQHFLAQPIYRESTHTKTKEETFQITVGMALGAAALYLLYRAGKAYFSLRREMGGSPIFFPPPTPA